MKPIGPYRSQWADKPVYIVKDATGIVRLVKDGDQPADGFRCPTIREARDWLKENGYSLDNPKP